MSQTDCKVLLDTCKVRVYADNGFRILDVPVDVSPRRLKRQTSDLQAAIDMGELEREYSQFLKPHPLPTAETIRQAGHQLQDTVLRFVHEFFWFWPMQWGESASDEGLLALKAGGLEQARQVWEHAEKTEDQQEVLVAQHNLAVLWHSAAIDGEMCILQDSNYIPPDLEEKINIYWQYTFKYWEALCANEAWWSLLADRVRAIGDPTLTTGFVKRFRDALPIAFDNINADIAAELARQKGYKRAAVHIRIMQQTNRGDDDIVASIRRITGPLHDRIDHAVGQATYDLQNNKREGNSRAHHLFMTTKEPLQVLATLLTTKDPEFIDTADQVAEAILVCQVNYVSETKDLEGSQSVLHDAFKLAQGSKLKERIRENIDAVETIQKQGHALEKRKREMLGNKVYLVKITGSSVSVPQACTCCMGPAETTKEVGYSWQEQVSANRSIQHTRSFNFPLCKACEEHQNELKRRQSCIVLSAISSALIILLLLTIIIDDASLWIYFFSDSIVLATVLTSFLLVFRVKPMSDEHGSRGPSVSMKHADKTFTTFKFHNPLYADAFAKTNGFPAYAKSEIKYPRGKYLWPGQSAVQIVAITIVVVVICHIGIYFGIKPIKQSIFLSQTDLEAYCSEFIRLPASTRLRSAPYLRGKLVVVDYNKVCVDKLYFDLPEELRATSYHEVGTVILLTKERIKTGNYKGGAPAYVQSWKVDIIDWRVSRLVDTQTFRGGEPPNSIDKSKSYGVGSSPKRNVVHYLRKLPQKEDKNNN